MSKTINYPKIIEIVTAEISRKGYRYEEDHSLTTNSIYFRIYSGDEFLAFRISDHKPRPSETHANLITFRTDINGNDYEALRRFVQKRIQDLSYRRVRSLLGMRVK